MSQAAPYVQIGADSHTRLSAAGQLLLSAAAAACCCTAPPNNPCTSAPSSVAITGYFDGFFSPCPDCTAALPSDCLWDGTFLLVNSNPCGFSNAQCFDGSVIAGQHCYDCQFSGRRMWQLDPPGPSQITFDPATNVFTLQIVCQNGGASGEIIWQGQKTGGGFTGTYQRTSGCDTHTTIEVS